MHKTVYSMERDFTSGEGCTIKGIFVIIAIIIFVAIIKAISLTDIFASISSVLVSVFAIFIVVVFIWSKVSGMKEREDAGPQYERNADRINICHCIYDTRAEISTFGDLEYINILSEDGYKITWSYDKTSEYLFIHFLLKDNKLRIIDSIFEKMSESLQEKIGDILTDYNAKVFADESIETYIEGLTPACFKIELSKDISNDDLGIVLGKIKEFAKDAKVDFAHRKFGIRYCNRKYELTYQGLTLESVSLIKRERIMPLDKSEAPSKYLHPEIRTLYEAIRQLNYDEDGYIENFKDL